MLMTYFFSECTLFVKLLPPVETSPFWPQRNEAEVKHDRRDLKGNDSGSGLGSVWFKSLGQLGSYRQQAPIAELYLKCPWALPLVSLNHFVIVMMSVWKLKRNLEILLFLRKEKYAIHNGPLTCNWNKSAVTWGHWPITTREGCKMLMETMK